MKVPKDLVGEVVAIQLARPVYVFNYAAHLEWTAGAVSLVLQHQDKPREGLKREQIEALVAAGRHDDAFEPVVRDVFPGVKVVAVGEDSLTFEMPLPSNMRGKVHLVQKTVGFGDIISYDLLPKNAFQVDGGKAEQRDAPSRIVSP